jgi:hypothetical protein
MSHKVNTFLLNTHHLKGAKKDVTYRADRGSLKTIRKFLERKKIDFDLLDWNIDGHLHGNHGGRGLAVEYDPRDRDEALRERLGEDKFIVLNSSGFFHHRSFYFVESLKEEVCYVQLDSHPDILKRTEGKLRAGGFVPDIAGLDNVSSVYVVGVTPGEDLVSEEESIENAREVIGDINLVLSTPLEELIMERGKENSKRYGVDYEAVYRAAMELYPHLSHDQKPTEFNVDELPDLPVYLSIDLDVIRMFPTYWQGHGRWSTINVLEKIHEIADKREIIGADICGLDGNFLRQKPLIMKSYSVVYKYLRYAMTEQTS